jgi:hypothetical protein
MAARHARCGSRSATLEQTYRGAALTISKPAGRHSSTSPDQPGAPMPELSFYDGLKTQQVAWARSVGIADRDTEADRSRPWVLKPESQARNLWDPAWWSRIAGKEHPWARALTSSQCFAVNLFAPLAADPEAARRVLACLRPDRILSAAETVEMALEFTPPQARGWLGESRQATQVDVAFVVRRDDRPVGYLLVEVKLGERRLGACRGAKRPSVRSAANPRPDRCRSLAQILADPGSQCWLAEAEGRTYWRYMRDEAGPFRFDGLAPDAPCPFAGGLYQLMRNRVLAQALVREGGAEWADLALCVHPGNDAVDVLDEAVGGSSSAQAAFTALLGPQEGLLEISPRAVIEATLAVAPGLAPWGEWVRGRYQL